MRVTAIMACAILAMAMAQAVRAAPLPDGGVTIRDVANVMRSVGLPTDLATDREGDPLIRSSLDGEKFQVYFYECSAQKRCKSIQFYAGWRTQGISQAKIGEWNRTKRFGRAYLDRDAEPCVEMDVDLEHGATTEAVANDFDRWRLVFREFRDQVGEPK